MSKETILLSSRQCYEAYDDNSNEYDIGSYSELYNKGFREIYFSDTLWYDEKDYFHDYIRSEIASFEKRYRTTVTAIALVGVVGVWNGPFIGGKITSSESNPLDSMGDVDDVEVVKEDDGSIAILGHHHDGTHHMYLYFLTDSFMEKHSFTRRYYAVETLKLIRDKRKCLKLTKNGQSFYKTKED